MKNDTITINLITTKAREKMRTHLESLKFIKLGWKSLIVQPTFHYSDWVEKAIVYQMSRTSEVKAPIPSEFCRLDFKFFFLNEVSGLRKQIFETADLSDKRRKVNKPGINFSP
jgi:hypothetical protein